MTAHVEVCITCNQRTDTNSTASFTHQCNPGTTATSHTHGPVTLKRARVSASTTPGTPLTCSVCRGSGRATGPQFMKGDCRVCRGRGAV